MVTGSRFRYQSDIWKFPIDRITSATTPSAAFASPIRPAPRRRRRLVPMNRKWSICPTAAGTATSGLRGPTGRACVRLLTRLIPRSRWGCPSWAPNAGNEIVFILTRPGQAGLSVIIATAAASVNWIPFGISANWSIDGRWVDYMRSNWPTDMMHREDAGRGRNRRSPCDAAPPGRPLRRLTAMLYFVNMLIKSERHRRSRTERCPYRERSVGECLRASLDCALPLNGRQLAPVLAPDGKWLAMPLLDVGTSNIWVQPTSGEARLLASLNHRRRD